MPIASQLEVNKGERALEMKGGMKRKRTTERFSSESVSTELEKLVDLHKIAHCPEVLTPFVMVFSCYSP